MRTKKLGVLLGALMAGGISGAMAQDEVPVTISGTIADVAVAGGCAVDASSSITFDFTGESTDWADNGDGRQRFAVVPQQNITIDCSSAATPTEITFATDSPDTRNAVTGCGENACTSYPVVFQPDPTVCQDRGDLSCLTDNLQEGYITVNLVGCSAATSSCTPGTFAGAKLTANANAAAVIATFSGTLLANAEGSSVPSPVSSGQGPVGTVMTSPRSPNPQLYVVYGE